MIVKVIGAEMELFEKHGVARLRISVGDKVAAMSVSEYVSSSDMSKFLKEMSEVFKDD